MERGTRFTFVLVVLLVACLAPIAVAQTSFHTRSIVACDPERSTCGIAVVSYPPGVGSAVIAGEPGVIVAKQAVPWVATGERIVDEVIAGADAPTALEQALAADPYPAFRQIGVAALDANQPLGVSVASYSGDRVPPEKCNVIGGVYAAQGAGQNTPDVCDAMANAFEAAQGSLARRLLTALVAGARVGGDSRGEFSAAIRVYVDDPVVNTLGNANVDRSVHWESELEFGLNASLAVTSAGDPEDLEPLTRKRAFVLRLILLRLGYYKGRLYGEWNDEAEQALLDFGSANLFFPRGTMVEDGERLIEAPLAEYIIQGYARGVLLSMEP